MLSEQANTSTRKTVIYEAEPTPARLHNDRGLQLQYIEGPFGSSKSSSCVMEILMRAMRQKPFHGIRKSRWCIVRNCYDEETEILTEKRGWQLFKDLLSDDKVAQLENGKAVFVLPTYYYQAPYIGDMLAFENEGVNFCVTPNHKMYVSKRVTRKQVYTDYYLDTAENIYGNVSYKVKRDADWEGVDKGIPEAVFEWLGLWFAEGSAAYFPTQVERRNRCAITQTKPDGIAYARNLFDKCGLKYYENMRQDGGVNFMLAQGVPRNTALTKQLAKFGKAAEKYVPDLVKSATSAQIRAFLKGFIAGDGMVSNGSTFAFTSSKQLADDLQELALKAGQVANVNSRDRIGKEVSIGKAKGKINSVEYVVTFVSASKYAPSLKVQGYAERYKGWHVTPYNGVVYCVEVPTHVVYVRRNGRAMWCSQTYPELKTTTIKTYQEWIPESIAPIVYSMPILSTFKQRLSDGTTMELEVYFMALDVADDVKKLLSMELTGAYINEGREIPWEIVEGIVGRIDRYPRTEEGGATEPGVLVDSNPPRNSHWLYTKFEADDTLRLVIKNAQGEDVNVTWRKYKQPPAVYKDAATEKWVINPDAENLKHLSPNYYVNQMALGEEHIRVNLAGEYGMSRKGTPVFAKWSELKHVSKEILLPKRGTLALLGVDFGLCYSADTEVLTEAGWKLFKDVDEKADRVATLNPNGFALEYTAINFKTEFDYDGEMVGFHGQNFDFIVTPEHVTPYTDRDTPHTLKFMPAAELASRTSSHKYVQLHANWAGGNIDKFGIPDEAFAKFMGWYLSEGSIEKIGNSYRVSITQTKNCPELDDLVMSGALDTVSNTWAVSNGWRTTVRPDFGAYLHSFGKAYAKRVPEEIKNATPALIRVFLCAYLRGDGHVRSKAVKNSGVGRKATGEMAIATVSRAMADGLQELCLKIGCSSTIRRQKGQTSTMPDGRKIISDGVFIVAIKKLHRAEINANHVTHYDYKGKIYCLNVPYHTLYVRRNGRPCWNGNTPGAVIGQLSHKGIILLDEIPATDESLEDFLDHYILPILRTRYQGYQIVACGDPSGGGRQSINKLTSIGVMNSKGIKTYPAITNAFIKRKEAVDWFLGRDEGFIVSKNLTHIREVMGAGYVFKEQRNAQGKVLDVPDKNEFSHVADAIQYLCLYARYGGGSLAMPSGASAGGGSGKDRKRYLWA